jgi:ribose/xylose/arabinose/galactoside ABC-type transport system permease subunit
MVQNGYPVPETLLASITLALLFGLINGWLIAHAEVPSLFTTLASGLFLAGLGQVAFFQLDVVQWPWKLNGLAWLGRGSFYGTIGNRLIRNATWAAISDRAILLCNGRLVLRQHPAS